jgi:tRNA dimethylallyltransferase
MNSSDDSGASGDPLRIIVGATGVGKSGVALTLAQEFGASIISADSRQIYRGFDIGTAKPTAADRRLVPHMGIDVADPTDRWSAARFSDAAAGWIREAERAARPAVVVGGTGFWISALVSPLASVPDLDEPARTALQSDLSDRSIDDLRRWCRELDPDIAHLGPVQLKRAIEVALLTGRRLTEWHRDQPPSSPRPVRYLLLDSGKAIEGRIAGRIDEMFARGWMEEVRTLRVTTPEDAIAWKACGYERIRDAMTRGLTAQDVRDEVVLETRQYARRQRTWFRRQLKHGPVTIIDPMQPDAASLARDWWNGDGADE